jgi:hypothetical protein
MRSELSIILPPSGPGPGAEKRPDCSKVLNDYDNRYQIGSRYRGKIPGQAGRLVMYRGSRTTSCFKVEDVALVSTIVVGLHHCMSVIPHR